MEIYLTRDSVAMGDDIDAPHLHTLSLPESTTIIEIVDVIFDSGYLANIHADFRSLLILWIRHSRMFLAGIYGQWIAHYRVDPR